MHAIHPIADSFFLEIIGRERVGTFICLEIFEVIQAFLELPVFPGRLEIQQQADRMNYGSMWIFPGRSTFISVEVHTPAQAPCTSRSVSHDSVAPQKPLILLMEDIADYGVRFGQFLLCSAFRQVRSPAGDIINERQTAVPAWGQLRFDHGQFSEILSGIGIDIVVPFSREIENCVEAHI
jgi:hypothetical protein